MQSYTLTGLLFDRTGSREPRVHKTIFTAEYGGKGNAEYFIGKLRRGADLRLFHVDDAIRLVEISSVEAVVLVK